MNKKQTPTIEKDFPMALRLRLGDILRERELTQTKFAEMSGLSRNAVSVLVNQPAQIKIETLETICNTLQIDPTELFQRVRIVPEE
jgi:DNA-binding Xre family transcriptional regulator